MGEGRTEKERKDKQTRAQPGWLGEMEERGGMLLDGMGEEEREEHDFVFPAQKAAERCCDWDRNGNGNGNYRITIDELQHADVLDGLRASWRS